jgi:alpha-L-fucosidase
MKMKKWLFLAALLPLAWACGTSEAPAPCGAVPSPYQWEWQKMETNLFLHFGPNTFTSKEWGNGQESEDVFQPTALDCRQWVAVAKAAGFKGVIITAKHHDGFCLWPNPESTHTVAQSSWRDGKGDVLRELSDACREAGLKFGVYVSPWDRNHPSYGTPEYNQVFVRTLEHIYANYGEIFEQWFDGACGEGPNGKRQVYDWPLFNGTVFREQPQAIIFSDAGPGCRWVGNEEGHAGRTNWSTVNVGELFPGIPNMNAFLNEGLKGGKDWAAAETDVSIRPGWFWRPSETPQVKSVEKLLQIWYESVGRNSLMLLNIPPDNRGLIDPVDSARVIEFRAALDQILATDLAAGARVKASATRGRAFSAAKMLDGDENSYWATPDGVTAASFVVTLPEERTFNRVMLQEYIPLGQRVESFCIDVPDGDGWKEIAVETTIGYKRIVPIPETTASRIRIRIEGALACPTVSAFALYMDPILKQD